MDIARTTVRAVPIRASDPAASGPASDPFRLRVPARALLAVALAFALALPAAAADAVPRGEKAFAKVQLTAAAAPSVLIDAPSAERSFAVAPAYRRLHEASMAISPHLGAFYDRLAAALNRLARSDGPVAAAERGPVGKGSLSAFPAIAKSGLEVGALRLDR